jgi:hypothetical protein
LKCDEDLLYESHVEKIYWLVTTEEDSNTDYWRSSPEKTSSEWVQEDIGQEVPEEFSGTLWAHFSIRVRDREPRSPHLKGLETLRESESFTDIKFVCGQREIPCHKVMLAAFSPVFRAMLEGERFAESKDGKIEIKDFPAAEVELVVKFIYSQDTDIIGEHLETLLAFADKYDIQILKTPCETMLAGTIAQTNAITMLRLSNDTNAETLKSSIVNFMKSHWSKFKTDASLEKLLRGDGRLATKLLFSIHS